MSDSPYQSPQTESVPPDRSERPLSQWEQTGDTTGGVIPYKNPHALIAYYLGLFSLFPILGIVLGIPAFVLGIIGLRNRKRNPVIKGSVHAWIGIIMGGFCSLVWGALIVGLVLAGVWGMAKR